MPNNCHPPSHGSTSGNSTNGSSGHSFDDIQNIRNEYRCLGDGSLDLVIDDTTGVAVLTINHFDKRNSFSGRMMSQFYEVLNILESWKEGKVVILRGSGGFFSSGADLTVVRATMADPNGGRKINILMQDNMNRFQNLPFITVAVIEGKALGGGAEISTACDFRVMTPTAEIGFVQVRMGISAGFGGGSRLVSILGPTKALELLASGRRLTAEECVKIGLASHILSGCVESDPEDVLNKTKEWIQQFLCSSSQPLQAAKRIVNAATRFSFNEALRYEEDVFASVWGGIAHQKAMSLNVKHK